jgi:uncharacterized membrane protein
MKIKQIVLISSFAVLVLACKKNQTFVPVCDGSNPTYDADISLIISQNCVQCHSNYSTYAGLSSATSNGSFTKEVLTNQTIPQNSSLSEAQLNKIQCWVENGFLEN